MSATRRRGAVRLALSISIAAGTLVGAGALSPVAVAAPTAPTAVAQICVNTSKIAVTCPTIQAVIVGSKWIRSSTAEFIYPIDVVVIDPANIAVAVDTLMGRDLEHYSGTTLVVAHGRDTEATVNPSDGRKIFTMMVHSPYHPIQPAGAAPAYGGFEIHPVVWGVDPAAPAPVGALPNQLLVGTYRSGSITAQSVITNTPSATTVHRAQWFTERGRLTRFDGTPQVGQKVNVYYVPAGTTRASFAGVATSSSTGAWSLPCRSWLTGSWFLNYPGSAFSTGIYKSVWIKVVA